MDLRFADLKKYLSKLDWFLIAAVFISTVYGWLLVKSTTHPMPTNNLIIIQSGAVFIGIVSMLIMASLDYCHVIKYTKYFYALAIAGMAVVLIFGEGAEEVGRGSWIRFFGIGIQPSELVKILYIVCLAKRLDKIKENVNHPLNIAVTLLYAGIILGMVVFDNLGSALVFIFITFVMFFFAGVSLWYFLAFGAVITALSPVIWNFMGEYQKMRILVGFDPSIDPDHYGWQAMRSMRAIGSGGLFGAGFQNGYITQNRLLTAQQTDFIFATAGEEFGFLGAILVIVLLSVIITRILLVSFKTKNTVGSLICAGVFGMFMAQTVENIGMCLGVMPVVGVTLPFFSYGGSSVVSCYMAIGLVLSVYSRRNIYYFTRDENLDSNNQEFLDW